MFRRRRLRRLVGLCLYICPAHGTVPPKRRRSRRRVETYSEISNIRTARREAGQMSTVLTAESARDVRLAWFHYKNVTHRAAPRRDAPRRSAPRPALSRRRRRPLDDAFASLSLSLSFSLFLSLSLSLFRSRSLSLFLFLFSDLSLSRCHRGAVDLILEPAAAAN